MNYDTITLKVGKELVDILPITMLNFNIFSAAIIVFKKNRGDYVGVILYYTYLLKVIQNAT